MVIKNFLIVFAALAIDGLAACSATAQKLTCNVTQGGNEYVARVWIENGRPKRFFYASMASNGHTCELSGAMKSNRNRWLDDADGAQVVLLVNDVEVGTVSIKQTGDTVSIDLLTPIGPAICATGATLRKQVVLHPNSEICSLSPD